VLISSVVKVACSGAYRRERKTDCRGAVRKPLLHQPLRPCRGRRPRGPHWGQPALSRAEESPRPRCGIPEFGPALPAPMRASH
jgi:hypothetical protein